MQAKLRVLHYCWFGGALPPSVGARIKRWLALHPGWQLQEWNEASATFLDCDYARVAASTHAWAYFSDYVRLRALYEHGGVYLDTDVELLQPLDPMIDGALHIGYMHNCALGTAVIISPPRHPIIGQLLDFYRQLEGNRLINNNAIFTEYFLQEVTGFKLDGRSWSGNNIVIHSKNIFEQPGVLSEGYAIHFYNRSWGKAETQNRHIEVIKPNLSFRLKRMLRSWLEESRCAYVKYYLRDRYHLPTNVPTLGLSFAACSK